MEIFDSLKNTIKKNFDSKYRAFDELETARLVRSCIEECNMEEGFLTHEALVDVVLKVYPNMGLEKVEQEAYSFLQYSDSIESSQMCDFIDYLGKPHVVSNTPKMK